MYKSFTGTNISDAHSVRQKKMVTARLVCVTRKDEEEKKRERREKKRAYIQRKQGGKEREERKKRAEKRAIEYVTNKSKEEC